MTKKAIILFSGGLDSTTCLAIATSRGYQCYALTAYYGQKHRVEIQCATRLAKQYAVIEHKIVSVPLDEFKGSSLTDPSQAIPRYNVDATEVPSTYVPARNTVFLALALSWAEAIGADSIFIGANQMDYSGYPDCRPDFLTAFEKMAALGTQRGREGHPLHIEAPLLMMTKAEIIKQGTILGVDYRQTISCYCADDQGRSCGECDSCTYRKKGFLEAKINDPTNYR